VLNLLTLAFAILFSCAFLELRSRAPTLDRSLKWLAGGLIVLAPLSLLNFHFFIQFSSAIALPWPMIAMGVAIGKLRRGYAPALFYLIAFSAVAIATVIYLLKTFNLIPGQWLIEIALQLGMMVETVLLSFALVHRMTILKHDHE